MRKCLSKDIRESVYNIFGKKCIKCGKINGIDIHHIVPVFKGGQNLMGNLIPLCKKCNLLAPNDPNELFNFLRFSIPADFSRAFSIFSIVLTVLHNKYEIKEDLTVFQKFSKEVTEDFWEILSKIERRQKNEEIESLSNFTRKYLQVNL